MQTNDKHAPWTDDQLKQDPGDDEDADLPIRTEGARPDVGPPPNGIDDQMAEFRSELARSLDPSAFPGGRNDLVASASSNGADPELVRALQGLEDRTYENVQAVWVALGGPVEGEHP